MNVWDERYGRYEWAYGTEPNAFVVSVADRMPKGRVLCLAEGEGRNAVFLAQRGHVVTAVDGSRVGLAKASRLAAERGVTIETVCADLGDYSIAPASWDAVVSIFAHVAPAIRSRVHRSAVQGLVAGGAFVLEAYTPAQLELRTGGPPTRDLMMELAVLREELAGLRLEIARELRREVLEGELHHGDGAVVQILGFRE